jgi:hypothetical protein
VAARSGQPVAALAVAGCLLLAGCSVGLPSGESTATSTLTPVPVPEEQGAGATGEAEIAAPRPVDGDRIMPGLRTEGVADPAALAGLHGRHLADRPYTRADSRTVVDANGTLRATRTDLLVAAGGVPFLAERSAVSTPRYDVTSAFSEATVYHDGGRAYYRAVEDEVNYGTDTIPPGEVVPDRTGRAAVRELLSAFEWEVRRVEIGGQPHYRLESTAFVDPEPLDDAVLLSDPRNATARLLVAADGRVDRYRLEYETTYDDRTVGVTETARWSNVGETTVPPPNWIGRARNATRQSVDSRSGGPAESPEPRPPGD